MTKKTSLSYKLTWRDHEQRWRKIYKGRTLYFPGDGGQQASYPRAWKMFLEAKATIDAELQAEEDERKPTKAESMTASFLAEAIKNSGCHVTCCPFCGTAIVCKVGHHAMCTSCERDQQDRYLRLHTR